MKLITFFHAPHNTATGRLVRALALCLAAVWFAGALAPAADAQSSKKKDRKKSASAYIPSESTTKRMARHIS